MTAVAPLVDADDEQQRIAEWLKRAKKPPNWRGRDAGGVISERQSSHRWEESGKLKVRLPELAVLLAWIDDSLAAASSAYRTVPPWWDDEYRQARMVMIQAEAGGQVGLSGEVPAEVDPGLRRMLLGPSALDEVLGFVDDDGHFITGLARLTPQERDCVWCWLEPNDTGEIRTAEEVRDLVDRRRGRYGMPLAIETVEGHLSRARGKLRRLAVGVEA